MKSGREDTFSSDYRFKLQVEGDEEHMVRYLERNRDPVKNAGVRTSWVRASFVAIALALGLWTAGAMAVERSDGPEKAKPAKPKSDGIILLDPATGRELPISPEDVAKLGGENPSYLLQVGDGVGVAFRIAPLRESQPQWDYKLEIGDQMEVRLSADIRSDKEYLMDVGDVIAIGFLDNWELSVTRTVRSDGRITAPEIGDVEAAGKTPSQLREILTALYDQSGLLQGQPRLTVNVDFTNADRLDNMSRQVAVRTDGAVRLPGFASDVHVAGLTVGQACDAIKAEAAKILRNPPVVSINVTPAINQTLAEMRGVATVQPDGKISIPSLPPVQAAGFSTEEVKLELAKASAGLCFNPIEPMVNLTRATGSRFYVGGEVRMPGVYPLDASPTVLQALLIAQGLTKESRMNSVVVMRRNPAGGKPFILKTNLKKAVSKGYTENDFQLRPFDVVFVPLKTIAILDRFVDSYINQLVPFDNGLGINANYYMNTQKSVVDSTSRSIVDSTSRNFNFNTGFTGISDVFSPTTTTAK